jgi:hypothetical protein
MDVYGVPWPLQANIWHYHNCRSLSPNLRAIHDDILTIFEDTYKYIAANRETRSLDKISANIN